MSSLAIPKFEIVNRDSMSPYAEDMHQNGFIIIRNLFEEDLIDNLALWSREYFKEKTRYSDNPENHKVQDAALQEPLVAQLACHHKLIKIIEDLYGRKAIPFQTLNFYKGSELSTHSDTIHFNSIPQRWMCGVWVALEDVQPSSGALHYYPGSHRLPTLDVADTSSVIASESADQFYESYKRHYIPAIKELIRWSNLEKKVFLPKKGDCLIWSANLLHGGEPIIDPVQTRLSQVTHYFFENCRYYTPLLSNPEDGEVFWRDSINNMLTAEIKQFDIASAANLEQEIQTIKENTTLSNSRPLYPLLKSLKHRASNVFRSHQDE